MFQNHRWLFLKKEEKSSGPRVDIGLGDRFDG